MEPHQAVFQVSFLSLAQGPYHGFLEVFFFLAAEECRTAEHREKLTVWHLSLVLDCAIVPIETILIEGVLM